MSAATIELEATDQFARLAGIPTVHFPTNLEAAVAAGRGMASILRETIALRSGPGKLTPSEYFYYRLWDEQLSRDARRQFVGKQAQQPMHLACNDTGWYATAADKLVFHTLSAGAGLPHPELLSVTGPTRRAPPGSKMLRDGVAAATFLRYAGHYPLFVKPIDGKYSLYVVSADRHDPDTDEVVLQDGNRIAVVDLAHALLAREAGYVVQRRLEPDARLARLFGSRLWSVRALLLLTPAGPVIHRAVAKIATGQNPADNFWRAGNMLGSIDLATGLIGRVVQGTGAEMVVDRPHPDTGRCVVGTPIPHWEALTGLVRKAGLLLPGIRTQSWDLALTDHGPVPLEVNFGGDLNLTQLAGGAGVLDDAYREHLGRAGYRL